MAMKDKLKMLYGNELEIIEGDEVADFTYFDNSKLKMIYLNSDIKRIGHGAFFGCSALKVVFFKDKEYKIDTTEGLDKFIEVFESEQGEIGVGAFETSSSSILIRECSDNKEKLHDEFVKALSPEPFCNNKNEKLFMKIVEGDDKGIFYISLLNSKMLAYDRYYFMLDNNDKEGYYYRPYFYEFIIEDNDDFFNKFDQNLIGEWMIGQLREPEEISYNEYALIGDVIFSASPIEIRGRGLIITEPEISNEIKNKINDVYKLIKENSNGIIDNEEDLGKIIQDVIENGTPNIVKIYNVGQASCNNICFNNKKEILFDIGYSYMKADQNRIEKNQSNIRECNPALVILSHWDLDHILGVVYSKETIFNVNWIAPSMLELKPSQFSLSAARLAKYLAIKRILKIVDDKFNGKKVYNSDFFQIWKGKGKENTAKYDTGSYDRELNKRDKVSGLNKANNIGLIIVLVSEKENNMLLPGDCEYKMFPDKLYEEHSRFYNMIAPHHGSNMEFIKPEVYNIIEKGNSAFISAGSNHYKPEHDWVGHCNFLKEMYYNIYKTKDKKVQKYEIDLNLEKVKDL